MRTRVGFSWEVPVPTWPDIDMLMEGNSAYLTVTVFNLGTDALDNTLFRFEVELEMSDRVANFLDWLLPDRRPTVGGVPHAQKGWCRRSSA